MRSLRELTVDERIRLEGRDARALAALAWLERVAEALRDQHPSRLELLAAEPPAPNVFERLTGFAEHQRWAHLLAAVNHELDRLGVDSGLPGARLQQLVTRARLRWPARRWRLWRRDGREGPWVRLGDDLFHVERAEFVAVDAQWAAFDGVRVPSAQLAARGLRVTAFAPPAPAPAPPQQLVAPERKRAKQPARARIKREPVITRRGVAWAAVTLVGLLFSFAARHAEAARVPVTMLFLVAFLAFGWWSRRKTKPRGSRRARKKRRATQLDLSFIPLLQRDTPHPVERPGKSGRAKRERKPVRR